MSGRASSARERGQALAEFALVAPIFFLLLFGIIELGILFGGQNGLVSTARELARYAAPYHVTTDVDAASVCADGRLRTQLNGFVRQAIPGYIATGLDAPTITYSWHPNADGTTYYVAMEVHVVYHFPLHVPLVGNLLDLFDGSADGRFQLDAREQMRIENEALTTTYADQTCSI